MLFYAAWRSLTHLVPGCGPSPCLEPSCSWHPFPFRSLLGYHINHPGIAVCVQVTLMWLHNHPKWEGHNAGYSDRPKRSCKVLPFKKNQSSSLNKETQNVSHMLRLLRSVATTNLLAVKLWRRKNKPVLVVLSHLKLQKLWVQCVVSA